MVIRGSIDPAGLRADFEGAFPFPHVVIDDFLDASLAARVADELERCDVSAWWSDEHDEQQLKRTMGDLSQLPETVAATLFALNAPEARHFFAELSGIDLLEPDDHYLGGGVHVSMSGGRLGIHADFNLHPDTGMHRRLNALIYLNRRWEPAWNGQLELWDTLLSEPAIAVEPLFNRAVVFRIRDDAFHGVRSPIRCPPHLKRWSLALYYYTADRPEEEKAPFHWASWQQPR